MSEEVTKPKNPGRVAADKRTAELNRKIKEDLLKNQKAVPEGHDPGTEELSKGHESSSQAYYGGGAAVTAAVALGIGIAVFFLWKRDVPAVQKQPEKDIFCMK